MRCPRHPLAALESVHCPACLLENALRDTAILDAGVGRRLMVQAPLGETALTSVLLVTSDTPNDCLLRLKTWRKPAPDGFLHAFTRLRQRLTAWQPGSVDVPLAAAVDNRGHPSVLSEFRKGVPILTLVAEGRLAADDAISHVESLRAATSQAHELGLFHGSVGTGNVIVTAKGRDAWLLDFGLTPLVEGLETTTAEADHAGFARLIDRIRAVTFRRPS